MAIIVDIDVMLARRKMSVAEFAEAVGITPANVAVLNVPRVVAVSLPSRLQLVAIPNWEPTAR
jgi:DNA-binding Xre family transcriptional regulator